MGWLSTAWCIFLVVASVVTAVGIIFCVLFVHEVNDIDPMSHVRHDRW